MAFILLFVGLPLVFFILCVFGFVALVRGSKTKIESDITRKVLRMIGAFVLFAIAAALLWWLVLMGDCIINDRSFS